MMSVLPKPNRLIMEQTGCCVIPKQFRIELGGFHRWCTEAFSQRTGSSANEGITWLTLNRELVMEPEEYRLVVDKKGAVIWASTETGVVWALTTLYQMADAERNVPLCEILDKPKYTHRGLCLDCARHFFAPSAIKQVIEQISLVNWWSNFFNRIKGPGKRTHIKVMEK